MLTVMTKKIIRNETLLVLNVHISFKITLFRMISILQLHLQVEMIMYVSMRQFLTHYI